MKSLYTKNELKAMEYRKAKATKFLNKMECELSIKELATDKAVAKASREEYIYSTLLLGRSYPY